MPVAALYDIHGNLPALEAVLQELAASEIDRVLIGGDAVLGPMSREVLDRLFELDWPIDFISGNCETAVLAESRGETPAVPEQIRETVRWTARQLKSAQLARIAQWPKRLELRVPGLGRVLFCHATPRSDHEMFTELTNEAELEPMFAGVDAAVVVCGHSHMQFDRALGKRRIVNAGSVGMPFGPAGAHWLLLGPGLQFRHTAYDLEKAAARIRVTGYPQASEFALKNVLQPPSKEQMLAILHKGK